MGGERLCQLRYWVLTVPVMLNVCVPVPDGGLLPSRCFGRSPCHPNKLEKRQLLIIDLV